MKAKHILLEIGLLMFTGCHKDTITPREDLVASLLGTYQVKTLAVDGKPYTLPDAKATGNLSVGWSV